MIDQPTRAADHVVAADPDLAALTAHDWDRVGEVYDPDSAVAVVLRALAAAAPTGSPVTTCGCVQAQACRWCDGTAHDAIDLLVHDALAATATRAAA